MSEPLPRPGLTGLHTAHTVTETPLIALAGQPNTGKSTLFNLLTGLSQHTGNWPGKTVERREGRFDLGGQAARLVDLPGTYSLTADSPEELIAREFILHSRPDLVVAVVNAAQLERTLYLLAELMALDTPLVVALNMMDVAAQSGVHVEAHVLQAALGVPVVPITASKAQGVGELLGAMLAVMRGEWTAAPRPPEVRADHRAVLAALERHVAPHVPPSFTPSWVALKLLEGDAEIGRTLQQAMPPHAWGGVQEILREHDDAFLAVASGRYEWIGRMVRAAVTRPRVGQIGLTERLDRWAAHPVAGLAILAGILGLVFWITFQLGSPLQAWLERALVLPISGFATAALATSPAWLRDMLVDGLIGGVGSVLTFLPILVVFFAVFALLEDVGYLARAAYVMDNVMHLMGLHGKSFLPLFLGFGCNVPAVMGTRVIESVPGRLLTILMAPLVPCTARMAVVAFIAPVFFGPSASWVSWGLVLLSLLILMLSGVVLNAVVLKGERSAFIMEMPLYHIPNARTVLLLVWQRSLSFVRRAGSAILAMSLVVWLLSYLPAGELNTSYLARFGQWLEPVGRWMGFDWRLTVALITSFPAKENAIATLGVLFGSGSDAGLAAALASSFSTATALSFLVVTMLFVPCMATVAVTRQETGSWRWALFGMVLLLAISVVAGAAVYRLASLAGL